MRKSKLPSLSVISGAKPLAEFIFGDEAQYKKIYDLKDELGLFRLDGRICGRPATIESRIREREAAAIGAEADGQRETIEGRICDREAAAAAAGAET